MTTKISYFIPSAMMRRIYIKVSGPCVQTFCIENDSYIDAI